MQENELSILQEAFPPPAGTPIGTPEGTPAPEGIPPAGAGSPPNNISSNESGQEAPSLTPEQESAYLNGRFGGKFKSVQEIEDRLKASEELEREHTQLKEKSAKSPFVNEYIEGLNKFVAAGGSREAFDRVQSIDLSEKADLKNILSMNLQVSRNLTKENADFKVMRRYRLEENADLTDPDVQEARIDMEMDAQTARESLEKYKVDALSILEKPDMGKVVADRLQTWDPFVPKVVESYKEIVIPIGDKEFTYQVPAETQTHLTQYLKNVLSNPNYDAITDENGIKQVSTIVGRELLARELTNIVNKVYADAIGGEQHSQLKNKVNPLLNKQAPPPKVAPVDNDTALAKQMDSRY